MPGILPVFPLPGALLLPGSDLPLRVFEPRYLSMMRDAMAGAQLVGMVQPLTRAPDCPDLHVTGCAGVISSCVVDPDENMRIILSGIARFRISEELRHGLPYRQCRVEFDGYGGDFLQDEAGHAINRSRLLELTAHYLDAAAMGRDWLEVEQLDDITLVNTLSMICPHGILEKQALLEAENLYERCETLIAITELALAAGSGQPMTRQ